MLVVRYTITLSSLQVTAESMEAYAVTDRVKWVVSWPGQAVLCISQMYWTTFMHRSIRNGQKVGSPQCCVQLHTAKTSEQCNTTLVLF